MTKRKSLLAFNKDGSLKYPELLEEKTRVKKDTRKVKIGVEKYIEYSADMDERNVLQKMLEHNVRCTNTNIKNYLTTEAINQILTKAYRKGLCKQLSKIKKVNSIVFSWDRDIPEEEPNLIVEYEFIDDKSVKEDSFGINLSELGFKF